MNVFITGASGFLGINLVRYLLPRGHAITGYDIAPFAYRERDAIRFIRGDIRDDARLLRVMNGAEVTIHCAAALPLYSKEDISSIDIYGTRNVLESARIHNVRRVIHISSTAVYGIPNHHPLREGDALHGVGPYGEAKIEAEKECVRYRRHGMCVSILRPKTFIGPERLGVFALLYDWARSGKNFPMIGSGRNRYQLLDVDDLCEAIVLCMTKESRVANDTFNIGAQEFTTMKEDFQAVLDAAGFQKTVFATPAPLAIVMLRVLEILRVSPLYQWVYETAGKDSFISIEKAAQWLGFQPHYSNQQALLRNYQWYLEHRHEFENTSGISHRALWKQGMLNVIKMVC